LVRKGSAVLRADCLTAIRGERLIFRDVSFTVPAGGALILAASMSTLTLAIVFVAALGVCAGAVYVVGFTLLHENVDDELRGRIFSVLYTIVRLCLLIAFALGPFLSELLDRASNRFFTNRSISVFDRHFFIPGERLTLWLAGAIIVIAGGVVFLSLRAGENAPVKADVDRV